MKNLFLQAFLILIIPPVLFANAPEPKDSLTAKEKVKEFISSFDISGYVDIYYSYNINQPDNRDNFGTTAVGRIFDGNHNQISLGLAQIKVDFSKNKTTVVADLVFGPNGELANYGNTGTGLAIKQAYVSYEFFDGFTLTAGQYGTHIGYELVDAPDNFHYSLSNLFGNGPFYHTGVKLDYAISDKFSVMVGVVNGWDALMDNNNAKSVTAQVGFTPNDDFYAYVNWIGGNENTWDTPENKVDAYKHMFDLTTGYTVSDHFSIGLNSAVGNSKVDNESMLWGGAALYLQYDINDAFGIGARGEYFDDSNGAQYLGTTYGGVTVTGTYTSPSGAFMIKPEVRFDKAADKIYYKKDGTSDSQTTVGIAIIGKFNR